MSPDPTQNQLIRSLPDETRRQWERHLIKVSLPGNTSLLGNSLATSHVYFPTTAVIALKGSLKSGETSMVALVGREGMVGSSASLGLDAGVLQATVLLSGNAWRLEAGHFLAEFRRGGEFVKRVLTYFQTQLAQIVQASLCNRHHAVEQQLALRLSQLHQHIGDEPLPITQADLAELLGVRREKINQVLGRLQHLGAVDSTRGWLRIGNAARLSQLGCECGEVIAAAASRLPLMPG